MKPYICAALLSLLALAPAFTMAQDDQKVVHVIPIEGEIERALVFVVRRGVTEAVRDGADAIIFDMDSPGGRVDSTLEIMEIISNIDVPVITYVDPMALSGGALVSLATDEIYMKPGSTIGDAMPIKSNGTAIQADIKEKYVSPLSAKVRAIAKAKGHNLDVVEAMIRIEKELKIDDEVICPEGQLLTLTSSEAAKKYGKDKIPLLSSGTVDSIEELLKKKGLAGAQVKTFKVSASEKIARWLDMTAISGLLLALGLLGIYIEFKTPGFGVPGIAGILLLAIWFWGYNVAGLAGAEEIALFIIGVILLGLEIFVIPGFGITGVAGLMLILISLMLAMVEHYPGGGWQPPAIHIQSAVTNLGLALTISAALILILARFLPEVPLFRRIMLTSALPRDEGYSASSDTKDLAGMKGIAESNLHPGGMATIDGKRRSVVSRGDFIDAGSRIVVAETHGNRIVVDKVREDQPS